MLLKFSVQKSIKISECFNLMLLNLTQNEIQRSTMPVSCTPSRFARVSQGKSWNTGNGSPDAVCFSVDKPGVVVVGAMLYGGGGQHDYELELLDSSEVCRNDKSTMLIDVQFA